MAESAKRKPKKSKGQVAPWSRLFATPQGADLSFLRAGGQNLSDPGYQGADFFFWGIPLFRIEAGIREGDQPLDADPGGVFVGLEFVEGIIHFLRGKQFLIDSYIPLSAHPLQIVFEDGSGQNARWDELSHSEKFLSLIDRSIVKFRLEWIF
jgi:hypothetical protein